MPQIIYTIRPGDTLSGIAASYGSTVGAIALANRLTNPDAIYPGTVITIPVKEEEEPGGPPPGGLIYTVQPGDTLYSIAVLFGTNVQSIAALNGITNPQLIFPGTKLILPENAINPFQPIEPGIIEYTIRSRDTLYAVSMRFGTTVQAILNLNPNIDPLRLYPGQVIRVPVPANAVAIYRGNPSKMMAALTFDATYGDNQTTVLLRILRDSNIRATFFLSGIWVLNFPDLTRAISAAGHEIGNHSYTHPHFTQISPGEAGSQVIKTGATIRSITGRTPYLFRPPYGEYSQTVLNATARLGYINIIWTIDTLDWKSPGVNVIIDRAVRNIVPGAIILMHQAAAQTPEALPSIIAQLRTRGYSFGTVTQILDP